MMPEAISQLHLSEYVETHLDARDSFTRSVDTIGLSRHQVHVATKQILLLRTQVAELQQQLFKYEEECAYLHNQTMIDAAHRIINAERHALDEQHIKDAEDCIAHVMQFDFCRKCNATCTRFKNICRPCTRASIKERSEKAKRTVEASNAHHMESWSKKPEIILLPPKSKKQQKMAEKPKASPLLKLPRIIESEWSRDILVNQKPEPVFNSNSEDSEEGATHLVVELHDAPNETTMMTEKSASGRRRARYTSIYNQAFC